MDSMAQLPTKDLYSCKTCQCSFSRHTQLQRHMASHTTEENMYEDIFFTMPSPKKDKQAKWMKEKHHCPTCDKTYSYIGSYNKHMWNAHGIHKTPTSTPKSPLLKVKCGKKDSEVVSEGKLLNDSPLMIDNVIENEKAVTERQGPVTPERGRKKDGAAKNKPLVKGFKKKYYECSICGKKMTQSSTLKAHMRIHTGERPYKCPICPKTFTFYQCLWNHSWSHKNQESFSCDQCPRKFRYYQCLWNHYKVHTNKKKNFSCDVCKMRFTTSSQLMCHMKKHPDDPDDPDHFESSIKKCGTKYLRTKGIKGISEMPFKCEICFKSFKLKVSMTSHMKKHHNFVSAMKPQLPPWEEEKGKDISLTENRTKHVQKQKRGPGRPRKNVALKEVKRKILDDSGECNISISKQHQICPDCNKESAYCVCYNAFSVEEQECNLSPSTTLNTLNMNGQNQVYISLTENRTKHVQKQKRGRGRPRKNGALKVVKRKILDDSGECNISISKQRQICLDCSKESAYCVCYNAFSVEEQVYNLSPSTTLNTLNMNGQNQVYHAKCKKKSVLNGRNEDFSSDEKIFSKSSLRRSGRLKRERVVMLKCEKCYHWLTSASELEKHMKCCAVTNPYKCQHCSTSFKSTSSLLIHQDSVHSNTQKEISSVDQLQRSISLKSTSNLLTHQDAVHSNTQKEISSVDQLQSSISLKSTSSLLTHQDSVHSNTQKKMSSVDQLQKRKLKKKQSRTDNHTCSCCGTIFALSRDYKKHIACLACICGRQFHCVYIFYFHLSTCEKHNGPVMEETVDQKFEDSNLVFITDENMQDDLVFPNGKALRAQETSESSQVFTDDFLLVNDTNDSLPSSTTSDPYQSIGWVRDPLSIEEDSAMTITNEQNSSSDIAEDPLLKASENCKIQTCKEEDDHIEIDEEWIDIKPNWQCIVCSQVFPSLSVLSTHSISHITDPYN